jgi:hypothetical protein
LFLPEPASLYSFCSFFNPENSDSDKRTVHAKSSKKKIRNPNSEIRNQNPIFAHARKNPHS